MIQVEGLGKRYRIGQVNAQNNGQASGQDIGEGPRMRSKIVNHVAERGRFSVVGIDNQGRGVRNED